MELVKIGDRWVNLDSVKFITQGEGERREPAPRTGAIYPKQPPKLVKFPLVILHFGGRDAVTLSEEDSRRVLEYLASVPPWAPLRGGDPSPEV